MMELFMNIFVSPGFYGFCYTQTGHTRSDCPNNELDNRDNTCEHCDEDHRRVYGKTFKEMLDTGEAVDLTNQGQWIIRGNLKK